MVLNKALGLLVIQVPNRDNHNWAKSGEILKQLRGKLSNFGGTARAVGRLLRFGDSFGIPIDGSCRGIVQGG